MTVIGITGCAGAGKDTVALRLVEKHGFVRRGLADPLREALYELNPLVAAKRRLRDVVNELDWDGAKRTYPEIRRLMQVFGTEVVRTNWDEEFWVDRFYKWLSALPDPYAHVVVPDVRYDNEACSVNFLLKVTRPGTGLFNRHVSEMGVSARLVDHVITNDGSIEDLNSKVDAVYLELLAEGLVL